MGKEFPILSVATERVLKDTGTPGRAFYTKVLETMRIRFLGILIFKTTNSGSFPETENKK